MAEKNENVFRFENKNLVTLTLDIEEKIYTFDCSVTNYPFIKKVAELSRETQKLLIEFNKKEKRTLLEIEKTFDFLCEKEKEIVEFLAPSKWEELFALAKHDVLNMVDLITFITQRVQSKGAQAKKASVIPEIPENGETV